MDKKTKSILDEILDYAPVKNTDLFIESRAQQVIASAANLLNLIKENYDAETADDLSRRLVRAIQSNDEEKFRRKMRSIREGKKDVGQ